MTVNILIPDKQSKSIAGLKKYQKEKVLNKMILKLNSLFQENSHNVYYDIHDRTSFLYFINSFLIIREDESAIDFFFDENKLKDEIINGDLSTNGLDSYFSATDFEIKPVAENEYIDRIDRLIFDMRSDFETYMSKSSYGGFWQDFKGEDK